MSTGIIQAQDISFQEHSSKTLQDNSSKQDELLIRVLFKFLKYLLGKDYLTNLPRKTAKVWLSNSGGEMPVTVSTRTCHLDTWSSNRRISRLLPLLATPSSCSSRSSLLSYSSESWICLKPRSVTHVGSIRRKNVCTKQYQKI